MGGFLSKVGNRYALGFAVGLCLLASFAVFFMGAVAISWAVALVAGGEAGDDQVMTWVKMSAVLWVPLAIGSVMPAIINQFGPMIRERRELERSRDLARFVEKTGRGGA